VILDDSAIAKGIRRITAVTGDEAFQVQKLADTFSSRILALKSLPLSSLDRKLKELGTELDNAILPQVAKHQLRDKFTLIKKDFVDQDKARKAKEGKEAVDFIKLYFDENKDVRFYVGVISETGNANALSQAVAHLKTLKGSSAKAALFFAVDRDTNKISYQSVVPKELTDTGLTATSWTKIVSEKLNGKMGGNENTSQGTGSGIQDLDLVISLANEFAKKLIL
jgi:alanyl-tRNA synthetase